MSPLTLKRDGIFGSLNYEYFPSRDGFRGDTLNSQLPVAARAFLFVMFSEMIERSYQSCSQGAEFRAA